MISLNKIVFPVFFALSVAGLLMWLSADRDTQVAPKEPPRNVPQADDGKPARETADKAVPPREPARVISLAEAVGIAEKLGKGEAFKAERRDNPDAGFKIELAGKDGKKIKIELAADGKMLEKKDEKKKR